MEWFYRVQPPKSPEELALLCKLPNLTKQCARIGCVWGPFAISLTPIRNGARYALISCPNALRWAITTYNGETLMHCSINQESTDPDFSASIREFKGNFRMGPGCQRTEQ
jgi:hypothetical protein